MVVNDLQSETATIVYSEQSQKMNNFEFSSVVEEIKDVDESRSVSAQNIDYPVIVENLRTVGINKVETLENIQSPSVKDLQDIGENQSKNLKDQQSEIIENLHTVSTVKCLQDIGGKQFESTKNGYTPPIVRSLKCVRKQTNYSEKTSENNKHPAIDKNLQDVDGIELQNMKKICSPLTNLQDVDEEQSQHMENTDFPKVSKNTTDVDETNFEIIDRQCRNAIKEKLQEVSVKESENEENIGSPNHVNESQNVGENYAANVGGEQSENENENEKVGAKQTEEVQNLRSPEIVRILQNVDLPVKNLHSPEYLENLELAEKGE